MSEAAARRSARDRGRRLPLPAAVAAHPAGGAGRLGRHRVLPRPPRRVRPDGPDRPVQQLGRGDRSVPSALNFATGVSGDGLPARVPRRAEDAGGRVRRQVPKADDVWLHYAAVRGGRRIRQLGSATARSSPRCCRPRRSPCTASTPARPPTTRRSRRRTPPTSSTPCAARASPRDRSRGDAHRHPGPRAGLPAADRRCGSRSGILAAVFLPVAATRAWLFRVGALGRIHPAAWIFLIGFLVTVLFSPVRRALPRVRTGVVVAIGLWVALTVAVVYQHSGLSSLGAFVVYYLTPPLAFLAIHAAVARADADLWKKLVPVVLAAAALQSVLALTAVRGPHVAGVRPVLRELLLVERLPRTVRRHARQPARPRGVPDDEHPADGGAPPQPDGVRPGRRCSRSVSSCRARGPGSSLAALAIVVIVFVRSSNAVPAIMVSATLALATAFLLVSPLATTLLSRFGSAGRRLDGGALGRAGRRVGPGHEQPRRLRAGLRVHVRPRLPRVELRERLPRDGHRPRAAGGARPDPRPAVGHVQRPWHAAAVPRARASWPSSGASPTARS